MHDAKHILTLVLLVPALLISVTDAVPTGLNAAAATVHGDGFIRFNGEYEHNMLAQLNQTIERLFRANYNSIFAQHIGEEAHRLAKRQTAFTSFARPTAVENGLVGASPLQIESLVHLSSQASDGSREIDEKSTLGLKITRQILNGTNSVTRRDTLDLISSFQMPFQSTMCPFQTTHACQPNNRFPTFDGTCNNLQITWLGKAETPYKRYLMPIYQDAVGSPRTLSRSGSPLPSPRIISRQLFTDNSLFDNTFTHLIGIFGQFLAHDITSASVSSEANGKIVDCSCNNGNPLCMSINMPSDENVMRMSCMRFTRSSAAFANFDCRLGHREQLNLLTSFVDGTQIYGPNEARSRELRSFVQGQLKTSAVGTRPHLPQAQDGACRNTDATVKCFAAGEGRVNENLALTGVQTVFAREHNRIAAQLATVNPSWDDNRLFAEARKIMLGVYQHIIYNEYLVAIIGANTAAVFDLVPLGRDSFYKGYNANVNPSLANEFATGAFRFGHTTIRNRFNRFSANNQPNGASVVLQDIIFRPVEAYNAAAGGMDSILFGLINEPGSKFDTGFSDSLQNHLFEVRLSDGSVIAIDLAAANINRGRDHGIPGYNAMREKCGFRRVATFQELADTITPDKIQAFSTIYEHPDDIDFYVGGLSEIPVRGAMVGPVFSCIIGNQFKDLKKGDRFFYENGPSATSFTNQQLNEIKKASMSKLMCDNTDITEIQPRAFLLPTVANNQRIPCEWLPTMDLSKWKE